MNQADIIDITSEEGLDNVFSASFDKPMLIFKHSVNCGISRDVFSNVSESDFRINLVIIQQSRALSNAIAVRTGIRHESPQAIIIKDGKSIYHASHYDIENLSIQELL